MAERVDAGAVGGGHRMQRLDGQRHASVARVGQQRRDAVAHLLVRAGEIFRPFRQSARDQHQAFGADTGGFVDGAAVVVERSTASGFVGSGKHAAAAQARDVQRCVADQLAGLVDAHGLDDVAPRRDGRDSRALAAVDQLRQRPRLHGRGIDGEQLGVMGKIAHHAITPRIAITMRMRAAARSGSASRPAASARRNSSARCKVERALSWPPTMMK